MRIFIIGAGQVGSTIVEALHDEHELTVIDTDAGRLEALGSRYDVGTVEADGSSRRVLEKAGFQFVARELVDDGPEPGTFAELHFRLG